MGVRTRLLEKQSALRNCSDRLAASISQVLEQGKATGEFDQELPTAVMLATFIGLLSPKVYERLLHDEQVSPEDLARTVGHIYFQGVAANSSLQRQA